MATDPDAQLATMLVNLQANTGRSVDEWITLAAASGKVKHGELVSWLKTEHGMTHGYANLLAHRVFQSDAMSQLGAGADLIAEMFAGDKAALRPIHDGLLRVVNGFGDDVELAPKKGYVSMRRATQFATLHPSTKTRFDLGLKLKGVEPAGRLEAAGSWNAMVTHCVRLASVADIDADVAGWLRQAYDAAG